METTAFLSFREGPQCSAGRYGLDAACSSPCGVHVAVNVSDVWMEGGACIHHGRLLMHELATRVETLIVERGMVEALGIVVPPPNIKVAVHQQSATSG